jgi:recombination protein RecA
MKIRGQNCCSASSFLRSLLLFGSKHGKIKMMAAKKKKEKKDKKAVSKVSDKSGKTRALSSAMEQIEKSFGKGSIMKLGERPAAQGDVDVIPTGSLGLDLALGVGGVPKGRIIEVFGPEMSGKTTLVLQMIAEIQRQGGTAAFVDAEHALDPAYAKRIGVNIDDLLLSQPDTGEQSLEIAETLVRSGAVDFIAIDSVAALAPRAEIEGEMGQPHVGLQARLMSQALRKLTGAISKSKTTVVFTNQIRHKIGVMFGSPETTSGGLALKFYASVRIDLRRIGTIKRGEDVLGSRVRATVKKNKVAPPFRKCEFDIMFNEGISKVGELLDLGEKYGIVKKSGAWYEYDDKKLGQGKEASKELLRKNPKIAEKIEAAIKKAVEKEDPS